ncbi:uncharacterized protein LOC143852938 [Tasmannia lanceolata]|uniref:uncharacterized protein LOC143852938 n=1 Tax=Tasmannia lanceolata TaxID=3420 RepID=UPI0040639528
MVSQQIGVPERREVLEKIQVPEKSRESDKDKAPEKGGAPSRPTPMISAAALERARKARYGGHQPGTAPPLTTLFGKSKEPSGGERPDPGKKLKESTSEAPTDGGPSNLPPSFTVDGSRRTQLLFHHVDLPEGDAQVQGDPFIPSWKVGDKDSAIHNPRVGVELCLSSVHPNDKEELRKLSAGALSRSFLHQQKIMNDLSAMASNRIMDTLADNLKLRNAVNGIEGKKGSLQDRVVELEKKEKTDEEVIAALQKDLEDTQRKLKESEEAVSEPVRDWSVVEVEAISKFKESDDFGFEVAFHALDFEVRGFEECKRQVLQIMSDFLMERITAPKTDTVATDSPLIAELNPPSADV